MRRIISVSFYSLCIQVLFVAAVFAQEIVPFYPNKGEFGGGYVSYGLYLDGEEVLLKVGYKTVSSKQKVVVYSLSRGSMVAEEESVDVGYMFPEIDSYLSSRVVNKVKPIKRKYMKGIGRYYGLGERKMVSHFAGKCANVFDSYIAVLSNEAVDNYQIIVFDDLKLENSLDCELMDGKTSLDIVSNSYSIKAVYRIHDKYLAVLADYPLAFEIDIDSPKIVKVEDKGIFIIKKHELDEIISILKEEKDKRDVNMQVYISKGISRYFLDK